MIRKLLMALWVAGIFISTAANAVGLGELKLNSALNQPLDAEIKILNVGDLSENELIPNLAGHEAFARVGVERVFFLTSIKFDVQFDVRGGAVIRLTTDNIVREPFLNFLVELHWPNGRIQREYTVLLDPPIFSETTASPVEQTRTAASATATRAQQPVATSPNANSRPAAATRSGTRAASENGGTHLVKKDETLWTIARDNRPNNSLSIRQTMLAIQRHNPDAFINNNINLLKAGQVLRIPSIDQVQAVSASEANSETQRQMAQWRQERALDTSANDTSAVAATEPQSTAEEGRLKLVSDDDRDATQDLASNASGNTDEDGPPGQGRSEGTEADATGTGGVDVLAQEEIDTLRDQVDDLKRLVSLKDEQLALLQTASARTNNATNAAQSDLATQAPSDEQLNSQDEPAATDESQQAAEQQNQTEDAVADTAANAEAEEKSLMDMLIANPLYIGGAIVIALIVLVALGAYARRSTQEREYPADLKKVLDRSNNDLSLPADLEEEFADESSAVSEESSSGNQKKAEATATADEESAKVVEEADIYIAYKRYERAAELLKPAILANPSNTELRLKLAEVYIATDNEAGLTQQEADLEAIGDISALERLDELKEQAAAEDEANLDFESVASGSVEETAEDELADSFDFDNDLESDDEPEQVSQKSSSLEDDDSLEFLLDEDAAVSEVEDEIDESLEMASEIDAEDDDDMGFLTDTDEVATKLDLARAYVDMGDHEAATEILNEVLGDGNDEQKQEAQELLDKMA